MQNVLLTCPLFAGVEAIWGGGPRTLQSGRPRAGRSRHSPLRYSANRLEPRAAIKPKRNAGMKASARHCAGAGFLGRAVPSVYEPAGSMPLDLMIGLAWGPDRNSTSPRAAAPSFAAVPTPAA